jgi:hypothetical protein
LFVLSQPVLFSTQGSNTDPDSFPAPREGCPDGRFFPFYPDSPIRTGEILFFVYKKKRNA